MVREIVVRVCACGEVTSLQIPWAWNFLTNSIQTPLASSRAQIHPVFHLSPHKWSHSTPIRTSTPLIFGGVLMLWQEGCSPSGTFSTERNSWTRKNPSRWNSKIFPGVCENNSILRSIFNSVLFLCRIYTRDLTTARQRRNSSPIAMSFFILQPWWYYLSRQEKWSPSRSISDSILDTVLDRL